MKRLAIGIALGLVAAPFTGCDKGEEKKDEASKEKGKDGKKGDDKGGDDAAPAAKGDPIADAMKLIPEGANVLIGMDMAAVTKSSFVQDNKAMLEQGETADVMKAAEACKVGMSTWKYAVVGGNTEDDDGAVIVVAATGLGKKDTLECIGTKAKEQKPDEKFEVGEDGGRVMVTVGDKGQKIYAVSDDSIVLVGKSYDESVKGLLGGKGKTALEGSLKDIAAAVDQSKHIYFGMMATDDMQQGPTAGMKHVTGTFDLSDGLAIAVNGTFGDDAKATEVAKMANDQFTQMKGMAGAVGIPKSVVDSVKIEAKGPAVAVAAKATKADLDAISKTIQGQLGGAPGGAPPAGAAAPH